MYCEKLIQLVRARDAANIVYAREKPIRRGDPGVQSTWDQRVLKAEMS